MVLQGYWKVPLRGCPRDINYGGLFTPRRVLTGVLNATGFFQATMGDVLDWYIDKIYLVRVDDIMIWGGRPESTFRELLEECLCNTRRTKRVAARRIIDSSEWTDERAAVWDAVRLRVSEAVPQNRLRPGFSVMIVSDESGKF